MNLTILLAVLKLADAITDLTYYGNRLHIEKTAEMPAVYIIHYDQEYWIDYDHYWQAPQIEAQINIVQNTGVSETNFEVIPPIDWIKSIQLTDPADAQGHSILDQEFSSERYLYFLNKDLKLKILKLTDYDKPDKEIEFLFDQFQLPLNSYTAECKQFIKRIYLPEVLILCLNRDLVSPSFILEKCDVSNKQSVTCISINLGSSEGGTINYKLMRSHFYFKYSYQLRSCDIQIYNYDKQNDYLSFTLESTQPCFIRDMQLLTDQGNAVIIISDLNQGLFIYKIKVLLPGMNFIQVAVSEQDKSLHELYELEFYRILAFPTQINQIKLAHSSEVNQILVSAYDSESVYLVKADQKLDPYIIREYGNLVQSEQHIVSHSHLAYNNKWFFNEVATTEGNAMGWDIYKIEGSDKLMPYTSIKRKERVQYVEFLDWYQNYFVIKTSQEFKIGSIYGNFIKLTSHSLEDAGKHAIVELSLSSPYDKMEPISIPVYFVAQNDRSVDYPSRHIETIQQFGEQVKYITSDLVYGPNINMTWQWSNKERAQVSWNDFYNSTDIITQPLSPHYDCSHFFTFPMKANIYFQFTSFLHFCIHGSIIEMRHESFDNIQISRYSLSEPYCYPRQVFTSSLNNPTYVAISFVRYERNSVHKINFFECYRQFTFTNSIILPYEIRVEKGVSISPSSYFIAFINVNSKMLHFYVIDGSYSCCRLIEQSVQTLELSEPVQQLFFIDDNTLYVTHISKCLITIIRVQQLYEMLIVYQKNKLNGCYQDILYNQATEQLVMFHRNNTIDAYLLYSPDTPIRRSNIPLFYDIKYLIHKQTDKVIAMSLDDGFYLLTKDQNQQVIYAYYQLGVPVHQGQLLAHYFENKTETKEHIQASVFEDSNILALSTHRADYLNNVGYFILHTENHRGVAGLNAEEFLSVEYIMDDFMAFQVETVNIILKPGIDEITKQNRTRIIDYDGKLEVSVVLFESGIFVTSVNKEPVSVKASDNFDVNLNQLFQGFFLQYSIQCPEYPQLCNDSQSSVVSLSPGIERVVVDVSERLRSSDIIQLFDIGEYGVIVQKTTDLIFGYDYRAHMEYYSMVQLVDMTRYQLQNVQNFFYFTDQLYTSQQFRFWALQGFNTTSQVQVLCIFTFQNQIDSVNQDLFLLRLLYTQELNYNVKDIIYSSLQNRFYVTYVKSQVHNSMDVIEIYFDDALQYPQATFVSKIDVFSTLIAPFEINSSAVHPSLPFIILGLKGKGILVLHSYTLDTIFVLDIQKFIDENYSVSHYDASQFSNIMILSDHLIGVMINRQAIYTVHLSYNSMHPYHSRFAFYYDKQLDPYIYVKYRLPEPLLMEPNAIILELASDTILAKELDSSLVPSIQQDLFSVWLSYNIVYESWEINLYDYFKSNYSKITLNADITREQKCTELFSNVQQYYPQRVQAFVFCNSKNGSALLYNYKMNLSQTLHFNLDSLQGLSLSDRVLNIEIRATNPLTSIEAYNSIRLYVLEREPVGYLLPLAGLLGGAVILGLMIMIYKLGALCRHKYTGSSGKAGRLTFFVKSQTWKGSNISVETVREMEMSFHFADQK